MSHDTEHPEYYKLWHSDARAIFSTLPQGQAQNLIGAMANYFMFGREPYKLPKQASAMFEVYRPRLDSYRRSVLNGMKNRRNSVQNPSENANEFGNESDSKTETDFGL